jgi:PIN domain nuclease of toxin-antitoxin system
VFIWLVSSLERIPQDILDIMRHPENQLSLSVVNSWEMQIKERQNKLELPIPRKQLFIESLQNGFNMLPIHAAHIDELDNLADHHRDPFDRMLMAQTTAENMVLVTADQKIHQYQNQIRLLWTGFNS